MRRKTSMILCVLTLLFVSGCSTDIGSSIPSSASPTESVENSETIAIKYMKDKYDLDCTVVKVYGIVTGFMGDSFDQVLMRPTDDPNGDKLKENEGQRYLDLVNFADQYGSTFAVYINGSDKAVIGDQYMWYSVYPLFYSWINDKFSRFTPNQTGRCHILDCNTVEGQFHYCFSPRYSFVTTVEELEIQLECMNVQICAYYLESSKITNQNYWDAFKSQLNSQYPFNYFNMRIYEVPDSIYQQAVSNVAIYQMVSSTDYPTWLIKFGSYL